MAHRKRKKEESLLDVLMAAPWQARLLSSPWSMSTLKMFLA